MSSQDKNVDFHWDKVDYLFLSKIYPMCYLESETIIFHTQTENPCRSNIIFLNQNIGLNQLLSQKIDS